VAAANAQTQFGKLWFFGILSMTFFRVTVGLDTAIILIKTRRAGKYLNYSCLGRLLVAAGNGSN